MLLRGQNLVGYKNYADDVVELFINKVADYGMDIIRVFDALNDIRNLDKSIEVAKKKKNTCSRSNLLYCKSSSYIGFLFKLR